MTEFLVLAQKDAQNDVLIRLVLIPLGLFLAFIGVLAIQQKRIHFRRWGYTLQGLPAALLGAVLALLGVGIALAVIASFFGLTKH